LLIALQQAPAQIGGFVARLHYGQQSHEVIVLSATGHLGMAGAAGPTGTNPALVNTFCCAGVTADSARLGQDALALQPGPRLGEHVLADYRDPPVEEDQVVGR
jgi:hypothetical protein